MRRVFAALGSLTGLAIALLPVAGTAQTAQPQYRPGLGDLMTMTVQPRHIKLAFAGREKNWTYAAYELHELEEAFERAAQVWPQWRSVPIAQMMDSVTKEPMAAVSQAIKDADTNRFNAAYKQLTEACNACHQAADRAMIVIRVPELSSFPDQDFQPIKP
ncbi:MAG: cytochrome family protein [Xanthobacteraceae bacterium]|jgi:hypothetical protein